MKKLTGIILAGGKSRRMGMEKGLVVFQDKPLIQWAVSVLAESCTEILISSNSDCYDQMGFKVVPDIYADCGPMVGIYSCLIKSQNRENLVLSCDMPFIKGDIFNQLAIQIGDAMICVPWHEKDHYEPLCGIYNKDCLPAMKAIIEAKNYKLPELFNLINFKALLISDIHPPLPEYYFMSVNSLSDLESANQLISHQ